MSENSIDIDSATTAYCRTQVAGGRGSTLPKKSSNTGDLLMLNFPASGESLFRCTRPDGSESCPPFQKVLDGSKVERCGQSIQNVPGSGIYIGVQRVVLCPHVANRCFRRFVGDRSNPLNIARSASESHAPFVEHAVLAAPFGWCPKAMPHISVLCDNTQGHLLAASPDQEWDRTSQQFGLVLELSPLNRVYTRLQSHRRIARPADTPARSCAGDAGLRRS